MNIPKYIGIFLILVVGTILTYITSLLGIWIRSSPGRIHSSLLRIAFTKMTFVMLFFMHVYWSPRLIWLAAVGQFFLARDNVRLYDAGLPDAWVGNLYRLVFVCLN